MSNSYHKTQGLKVKQKGLKQKGFKTKGERWKLKDGGEG